MDKKRILSFLLISLVLISTLTFLISTVSASSNSTSTSSCVEDWDCTSWTSCRYDEKERDCRDLNHCGTTENKPSEIRSCNSYDYYDYYYTDYNYYNNRFCDPNNYYGKSHPCHDILRDYRYIGNYYDDYQYQVMNYYENQYNPANSDNAQKEIQVVYLNNDNVNENYRDNYKPVNNVPNINSIIGLLGIVFLVLLIFLIIIVILIVALRR